MWPWFAASDSHVWAYWEGLLLASNLPIAVEQDGPAALVLMQKAAVLEVGDKRHLALHIMMDSSSSIVARCNTVTLTKFTDQAILDVLHGTVLIG